MKVNQRRGYLSFLMLAAVLVAPTATLALGPTLPSIFGDNMVLQRDRVLPIWGTGDPNGKITILFAGQTIKVDCDAVGRWRAELPSMPAGGPHEMTIKGWRDVTFKNIMVGEVWVCSGQSNMAWRVAKSADAEKEIATANHPEVRMFTADSQVAPLPATNVISTGWKVCNPETVATFSAVGYFFGRELHGKLNVPIGLINTSWGGTPIEPWTPPVGFASVPSQQKLFEEIEQANRTYAKLMDIYFTLRKTTIEALVKAEQAAADDKSAVQTAENIRKQLRQPPPDHPLAKGGVRTPTAIYNAMVDPLVPYGIAGAIWYQGEANCVAGDGLLYFDRMQALINGWRSVWGQGNFPFYYVQLAPWEYAQRYAKSGGQLPLIWQAQTMALSIPNTGMAVINDIGDVKDIHPTNKQEVGRRLALWALAKTYGQQDLVYSGPLYKSSKVEGNQIRIMFDHAGSGLVSRDGKPLSHFQVAGDDRNFVDAVATIDGDSIVVSAESVAKPVAVRFGWNEVAEPNLMNKEGLPASSFRTDGW